MKIIKEKLKNKRLWNENLILLGDTNLHDTDQDIVDLITDLDFFESEGLNGKPTNKSLDQIYDRIFMKLDRYFKLVKDEHGIDKGDVFNLFDYVLTDDARPCLLYTSPSPRDKRQSRMPSSA